MNRYGLTRAVLICFFSTMCAQATAEENFRLENGQIGLSFDGKTGTLTTLENKLTGESCQIVGDEFAVEAVEFRLDFPAFKLTRLERSANAVKCRYEGGPLVVEAVYSLHGENGFAEKRIAVTSSQRYGFRQAVLSQPAFHAAQLQIVPYRYPKYQRKPGSEPSVTYFCRTPKGGFFTGVEAPFDASTTSGRQVVLRYKPSLKIAAGETVDCEPIYFGAYRRRADEPEKDGPLLRAESDAMTAMTSAILGPPQFGLVPMVNGWQSEMDRNAFTEQSLKGDMGSVDFMASCGFDWYTDAHAWGGEWEKLSSLGPDDKYEPGPMVRRFLEHCRKLSVKVVMFPTMNNANPWANGKPFRADKPEWLMDAGAGPPADAPQWRKKCKGNCLANRPFFAWLERIISEGLATGLYDACGVDGDFFGGGGWYTTIVPVDCQSNEHDHLPGDSNYACQQALGRLIADVRKHYPRTYIFVARPPMDLGVWSLRNVNACFTLLEFTEGNGNLAMGDVVRKWSRARVLGDFFPHYLDVPLLFPNRVQDDGIRPPNWTGEKLDYILLSAFSSSPNQLYYLPTKTGMPERDKAEIRKWLDWGRKNIEYLKVRKDLPDWPAAGKVDGSAHIAGDRGLIFLFNSGTTALQGEFALTEESIGLKAKGQFQIVQEYPASDRRTTAASGDAVHWSVAGHSAVVLQVRPADADVK